MAQHIVSNNRYLDPPVTAVCHGHGEWGWGAVIVRGPELFDIEIVLR